MWYINASYYIQIKKYQNMFCQGAQRNILCININLCEHLTQKPQNQEPAI